MTVEAVAAETEEDCSFDDEKGRLLYNLIVEAHSEQVAPSERLAARRVEAEAA